ncbi:MAG: hypothetical protein CVU56_13675 [Deltaproteobacteria bacterium HGW-Deltaproteobacteria-14]|nr:MAG: hypothetical protein CVU56_13675 [Deltaproteobacteria bacterium HGW-Deltaproteobacteria-14]
MYLDLQTYTRPATMAEALAQLAAPGAAALAGGTHLNVHGHEHLRAVVDLQALGLAGVAREGAKVRIGAMTALTGLVAADLPAGLAALGQAADAEKNRAVRNRSTVGGRISRDRSNGRVATALLGLEAEVELATGGPDGVTRVDLHIASRLHDVATGAAHGVVTAVRVPADVRWSGYLASQLSAVDAPSADVAVSAGPRGVHIATGGHGRGAAGTLALPTTAAAATALLANPPAGDSWRAALREVAVAELPAHGDALVSGDYRRDLAATLVIRLVAACLAAHGGAA